MGALEAAGLGDGLLVVAAIVVALEADVGAGGRQVGVLAAPLGVGQVHDIGVAAIVLPVDGAGQEEMGLGGHIDAVGAAALEAAQPIRRIDMPVAQARVALIAGRSTIAVRIEPGQAAPTGHARRYRGHAHVLRLLALLHLQLLARPRSALGILRRVAAVALQGPDAGHPQEEQTSQGQDDQLLMVSVSHTLRRGHCAIDFELLAKLRDKEVAIRPKEELQVRLDKRSVGRQSRGVLASSWRTDWSRIRWYISRSFLEHFQKALIM